MAQIQSWQTQVQFSPDLEWVGEMILQDAYRILTLGKDIKTIDQKIAAHSEVAQTIGSLPGFGKTSMAEIAGEVGSLERFKWLCRN